MNNFDYGDALQAFRNTFKTDYKITNYSVEFIASWCYGWLTAKGVCCCFDNLLDKIKYSDQLSI